MARLKRFILGAVLLGPASALPTNGLQDEVRNIGVKRAHKSRRAVDNTRAQAVVDTFKLSWEGYYKYAFPNDELKPASNSFSNSRNKWGASAVDALSTAALMGQKEVVNQIISYIPTINWSQTPTEVSLFETTIRYLGGMLAGYDLLSGPLANLAERKEHVDALLAQSINLANNLSYAFETPSGVPYNNLNFANRGNDGGNNGLATVGTLILEWVRLADLSGNKTYAALVEKAEQYLLKPSPPWNEPFPGLLGMDIDVNTGEFTNAFGGWIGGADSFYEYLIKMWMYDPNRYAELKNRWIVAADSTMKYLTSHPKPRPDLTFVAYYNNRTIIQESQHLACFDGGNFILAGQVLGQQQYIDYGLELTNGCHATYSQTATGIGPDGFGWDANKVPNDQKDFFNRTGFYINSGSYILRPEVMESFYYAYRATGDTKYQDWAWNAFVAINATTHVGSGYSEIKNVNVAGGGGFADSQESFWFAEVLKYSYLIHAEEADWQVQKDGKNKWVFNTEAHPVKVFGS